MLKSCLSSPRQALINGVFNILIHLVGVIYTTPLLVALDAKSQRRLQTVPLICWIWCSVAVGLSVLMILGVLKKRYKLIAPYICLGVLGMALNSFIWLFAFIVFYNFTNSSKKQMQSLVVPATVITAFQFLLWLPVYCLYKTWRTEATRTGRIIQINDVVIQPLVVA